MGDIVHTGSVVVEGSVMFNESALTRESIPAEKGINDEVYVETTVVRGKSNRRGHENRCENAAWTNDRARPGCDAEASHRGGYERHLSSKTTMLAGSGMIMIGGEGQSIS